ncbi:thiol-disulfide isomerase/thioredoxin [Chryseomicrobium aureum]|uniref:redoxin domain-containing protein n=1 Tax=Chryseomicrobium aureum TaxID=1441723 RepID=UPI001959C195|nr:thiol-disulfide isomerase/thioredoxin [Chryseomicrobium aureum]
MKKIIALLGLAVLIGIATYSFAQENADTVDSLNNEQLGTDMATSPNSTLQKGDIPPQFTLQTLDEKQITLSELKGKKVILNFWATWCPPCKAEMPHMQKFHEQYGDEVEIVAVNLTSKDSGIDKIEQFVRDYELTFSIPLDETGDVGDAYEAITIPTSYIIGTDGRIQHKIVGPMDEAMMEQLISSTP